MKSAQQRDLFTRRWRQSAVAPDKEVAMQIQLVSMLRWCLKPTVIMRHVPNGELRDKRTAAKLKAMGVLPGSADLEFFYSSRESGTEPPDQSNGESQSTPVVAAPHFFRALFLELKLPGKTATDQQVEFGLAMRLLGAEYAVVRSIDDAIAELGTRGLIRTDVTVCGKRFP
jgi:hypothetical protein